MPRINKVLQLLREGPITTAEYQRLGFSKNNFAVRIFNLREAGYVINTNHNQAHFKAATYVLVAEPVPQNDKERRNVRLGMAVRYPSR